MHEPVSTVDLQRRFGGMRRLYGVQGAQRVAQAHVAVVGIGGVGSWVVEALARSGVGALTLVDMDHVAESNINRQIHATDATLGQAKIQAMAERVAAFHPHCHITGVDDFVSADNWPAVLPADVDAVIDACDQVRAKVAMAAWARQNRRILVSCGAAGGKRLPHAIEVADLSEVTHDPLLAQVRQQLRKHHGAPKAATHAGKVLAKSRMGLTCVFSREAVALPDPSCAIDSGDGSLNCHGYGSAVTVTASFGLCAASVVLERLAAGGDA